MKYLKISLMVLIALAMTSWGLTTPLPTLRLRRASRPLWNAAIAPVIPTVTAPAHETLPIRSRVIIKTKMTINAPIGLTTKPGELLKTIATVTSRASRRAIPPVTTAVPFDSSIPTGLARRGTVDSGPTNAPDNLPHQDNSNTSSPPPRQTSNRAPMSGTDLTFRAMRFSWLSCTRVFPPTPASAAIVFRRASSNRANLKARLSRDA